MVQLVEKHAEFNLELWSAAIDFEKAFDSIEHERLWEAMLDMEVHPVYVRVLSILYAGQQGVVITDKISRRFEIRRGEKQGDPLSPVLFNAVLQQAMGPLVKQWVARGWGVKLGKDDDDQITNLRFADDLIIVAATKVQLQTMLRELAASVKDVGLCLHWGKTKCVCNIPDDDREECTTITVDGRDVQLLKYDESLMYLGRALSFGSLHDAEIGNRMTQAWKKFMASKKELCCKFYPLKDRLKLFQATVTPCALYASGTWTMTQTRERIVRSTQRKMLRLILGTGRRKIVRVMLDSDSSNSDSELPESESTESEMSVEPWTEWITRVTHTAELAAAKAGVRDWVVDQRRRKWQWAGHIARRSDGRWGRKVLDWCPHGCRSRGRPVTRWTDALSEYFKVNLDSDINPEDYWKPQALDREIWNMLEKDFVDFRE